MKLSIFGSKPKYPDSMLPLGWQFYSRPTNLELPGTVFRISKDGIRFIVRRLAPVLDSGPEPGLAKVERLEVNTSVIARLLGLEPLGTTISSTRSKILQYEIIDPVRLSTSDESIDKVLAPALKDLDFKPNQRYYVIREVRTAAALRFTLSNEVLGEFGGQAAVATGLQAGLTFSQKDAGTYELAQRFPERLGVMFLPDEIAVVRAGLAGSDPHLGRLPVEAVLDWIER